MGLRRHKEKQNFKSNENSERDFFGGPFFILYMVKMHKSYWINKKILQIITKNATIIIV
jgi:hypothetical protein